MDRLTSMAVFVRTVELGSFAEAARDLAISPQMVTKHVAYLEARLGTQLLNRTTRRQGLTEIDRDYFGRCKIVLAEVATAEGVAQEMNSAPSGTIRVSASLTFGAFSMPPFMSAFLSRFPEMKVDLILSDRFSDPVDEGFDVVIRIGEIDDTSMIGYKLRPYRLIACASPEYLSGRPIPQNLTDLAHHDWLVYGDGTAGSLCRWTLEAGGKRINVMGESRMRSNSWAVLMDAAISGHGIVLGPQDILNREIQRGRLCQVLPEYTGPERPMHALVPSSRRQTVKVRNFIDAIVSAFGE